MTLEKIGRYEIKGELGRGGMATVVRGYDPHFKREVALKLLPREFLHDPLFRARFEREAETIAALEHAAIVPVYDFNEEGGQPYFVMRLMVGGSLAERLKRGALSLSETVRILTRLAPALDEAHAKGIIHRDLKPGNILFDQRGDAYISDFGTVKLSQTNSPQTSADSIIGTPAYMSPEQARGESTLDGRSDVYALGVIAFEMLTGQQPYVADTPVGVVVKHLYDPVPRLRDLNPDLPNAGEAVIFKAMQKDRAARFPTASEFARALSAVAQEAAPSSTTLPRPTSPASAPFKTFTPRLRWVSLLAGGLGLMALFASSMFFLTRGNFSITALGAPTATMPQAAITRLSPAPMTSPTPLPTLLTPTLLPTVGATPRGGSARLAFVSRPQSSNDLNDNEIYLIQSNGTGLRRLTNNAYLDYSPAWSPDGRWIAFYSDRDGDQEIYLMDADGQNLTQLTSNSVRDIAPAWSSDGKRLVFISERDGNREVYVMQADGSGQTRLTQSAAAEDSPAWSPNGGQIAFISERDGNGEIYLMNADGVNQRRITNNADEEYTPAWSPDGQWIAFGFEPQDTGNDDLYLLHLSDLQTTRLTDHPAEDYSPVWSPDGQWIAFASTRNGFLELYLLRVSEPAYVEQLTAFRTSATSPDWQSAP